MPSPLVLEVASVGHTPPEAEALISETPFKGCTLKDIMSGVEGAWKRVLAGRRFAQPQAPMEMEGFDEEQKKLLVDIAGTKKRSETKFADGRSLFFTSEGLRWATPETAAYHCAVRMSRELIMDLTCGQGGQSMSFARTAEKVVAVDIDPMNCLLTLMNCLSRGIHNVIIVRDDCFGKAPRNLSESGCAVFCDPARPPVSQERDPSEMVPDPREVFEAYRDAASGMCFEVPPYMSIEKLGLSCEAEHVSIDGRLNRVNLYTGDLMSCERSAVVLPGGHVLKGEFRPVEASRPITDEAVGSYAYEIDPAVVRAGLVRSLVDGIGCSVSVHELDGRRTLLFSKDMVESPFLKQGYEVMAAGVPGEELSGTLDRLDVGKVTLRFEVDPGEYWAVRRGLEERLEGRRKVQLFRAGGYIVLQKMKS